MKASAVTVVKDVDKGKQILLDLGPNVHFGIFAESLIWLQLRFTVPIYTAIINVIADMA